MTHYYRFQLELFQLPILKKQGDMKVLQGNQMVQISTSSSRPMINTMVTRG